MGFQCTSRDIESVYAKDYGTDYMASWIMDAISPLMEGGIRQAHRYDMIYDYISSDEISGYIHAQSGFSCSFAFTRESFCFSHHG